MARILVTGAAGFVGSHCAKTLKQNGYDITVLDSLQAGRRDFLRYGDHVEGDIRDAALLNETFAAGKFDAVVHFAALSAVGESIAHPELYYDTNVHGTATLLDAMRRAGVNALVFSSSCAVYGELSVMPITEDTPKAPVNPYGTSKLVCETMMDEFGHAHGLRSVRLRYFNAAGADPDAELGEDHDRETRLIPLALDALTGRRPPLNLFGSDYPTHDGTALRDYIHVMDLADAHLRALRHLVSGGATRAVNLGTGKGATVKEVLDMIAKVTGRKVPAKQAPRRPGDPAKLVADAAQAREFLGWQPARSDLETIVADAWRWHQKRFPD